MDVEMVHFIESLQEKIAVFDKTKENIRTKLEATGVNLNPEPPAKKEPKTPQAVTNMSKKSVGMLYDKFLLWYDYLSDEITKWDTSYKTAAQKLKVVEYELKMYANTHRAALGLPNADLREAWTNTHAIYVGTLDNCLYYKQLHSTQVERRLKVSKTIERLWRELSVRRDLEYKSKFGKNTVMPTLKPHRVPTVAVEEPRRVRRPNRPRKLSV